MLSAQSEPTSSLKEHQIKAAYLYNFAKFVEWPRRVFSEDKSPFIIGVWGGNPFGADLETVVKGRLINGHPVKIVYLEDSSSTISCHILFVPEAHDRMATKLLPDLIKTSVLTVGESDRFQSAGGIITFVTENEKVRFDINMGTAEKAGLKISSQLQKLAKTISK